MLMFNYRYFKILILIEIFPISWTRCRA